MLNSIDMNNMFKQSCRHINSWFITELKLLNCSNSFSGYKRDVSLMQEIVILFNVKKYVRYIFNTFENRQYEYIMYVIYLTILIVKILCHHFVS